jgi:hypothetical protein
VVGQHSPAWEAATPMQSGACGGEDGQQHRRGARRWGGDGGSDATTERACTVEAVG